ncbi:MAG TPA: hypothetical protein VM165_09090 [Planctomycetaceae bacterium]|nr:hypothetical protein [Planctomycetaceae bacterium]
MAMIYFATWAAVQLAIPVVLIVAARRNRAVRPQAARLTFFVVMLQIANVGLTLLLTFLPIPWNANVPWDQSLSDMLADPATWAYIVQRWMYALLPAAITLITTYVILEQPDRPRTIRPEESAS